MWLWKRAKARFGRLRKDHPHAACDGACAAKTRRCRRLAPRRPFQHLNCRDADSLEVTSGEGTPAALALRNGAVHELRLWESYRP